MPIEPSDVLLDGRVAVVTGAGSGIGRGIAAGFAAFGAVRGDLGAEPGHLCRGGRARSARSGIPTDVRDSAAVDAALARTTEELGPVSILVNNAGGVFSSPILETTENGWDALYRSNLKHVRCSIDATQGTAPRGGERQVVVGDDAGWRRPPPRGWR